MSSERSALRVYGALSLALLLSACGGSDDDAAHDAGPIDLSSLFPPGSQDAGEDASMPCTANVDCDDRNPCNGLEQCEEGRCSDPPDVPAAPCALMDGSLGICALGECSELHCGDGVLDEGEACDDAGESATCNEDCTRSRCGDRNLNRSADEQCDDGEASAGCNADCTLSACGDGVVNAAAGEQCEGSGEDCDPDCTLPECGDGVWNAATGEQCDDGGASESCNVDCTVSVCGDGVVNAAAGEDCDDQGESEGCNRDCTEAQCGDGTMNREAGEECDESGRTADCDADCTLPVCGDGVLNTDAGEACDDGGESADCNADCSEASCGDQKRNASAGEACDEGGETLLCDADCSLPACGDGVVNEAAGEFCDVTAPTAECDSDCTQPSCGDGLLNPEASEECDPPTALSGDGCETDCTFSCFDDTDCSSGYHCEDHACKSPRWRAPEPVSEPGDDPADPYLAWDGQGSLVLAWSSYDGSRTQPMYAVANGGAFGPPTPVDPAQVGDAFVSSIFSDGYGNVMLGISGEPGGGGEARVARYTQASGMSAPVSVGSGAGYVSPVVAFQLGGGTAFAAWIEQTLLMPGETFDVRGARDTGTGFGSAGPLEGETLPLAGPLAFDARNQGMVAFQHPSTGIYVARVESDFLPATLVAPVGAGNVLNGDHRIAVDAYGGAALLWTEHSPSSGDTTAWITVYDEMNGTWKAPAQVGNPGADAFYPQLALTQFGNGHAALVESSAGRRSIQLATCYTSYGCNDPVEIFASSGLYIDALTLGDDHAGNAYLAWVQGDGTSTEIVARRYPAAYGGDLPRIVHIATVTNLDSLSAIAVEAYSAYGALAFVDDGTLYVARNQ